MSSSSGDSAGRSWKGKCVDYLLSWIRSEVVVGSEGGGEEEAKGRTDGAKDGGEGQKGIGGSGEDNRRDTGGVARVSGREDECRRVLGNMKTTGPDVGSLRLTGFEELGCPDISPYLQIDDKNACELMSKLKRRREEVKTEASHTPSRSTNECSYTLNSSLYDQLVDFNESIKRRKPSLRDSLHDAKTAPQSASIAHTTRKIYKDDSQTEFTKSIDQNQHDFCPLVEVEKEVTETNGRKSEDYCSLTALRQLRADAVSSKTTGTNDEAESLPLVDPDTDQESCGKEDLHRVAQDSSDAPSHSTTLSTFTKPAKTEIETEENEENEPKTIDQNTVKDIKKASDSKAAKRAAPKRKKAPVKPSNRSSRITRSTNKKMLAQAAKDSSSPEKSGLKDNGENKYTSTNGLKLPERQRHDANHITNNRTALKTENETMTPKRDTSNKEINCPSLEMRFKEHIRTMANCLAEEASSPDTTQDGGCLEVLNRINSTGANPTECPIEKSRRELPTDIPLTRILNNDNQFEPDVGKRTPIERTVSATQSTTKSSTYASHSPEGKPKPNPSLMQGGHDVDDSIKPRRSLTEIMKEGYKRKQLEGRHRRPPSSE